MVAAALKTVTLVAVVVAVFYRALAVYIMAVMTVDYKVVLLEMLELTLVFTKVAVEAAAGVLREAVETEEMLVGLAAQLYQVFLEHYLIVAQFMEAHNE